MACAYNFTLCCDDNDFAYIAKWMQILKIEICRLEFWLESDIALVTYCASSYMGNELLEFACNYTSPEVPRSLKTLDSCGGSKKTSFSSMTAESS